MNTKYSLPSLSLFLLFFTSGASASTPACIAQNSLSRDSFDVAGNGIQACLEGRLPCQYADNKLKVAGLDEGVGAIQFVFQNNGATTKTLVGFGIPDTTGSEPGIILRVKNLPRETTMESALRFFYELSGAPALPCSWTSAEKPLGQYLTGRVIEASCDANSHCVVRFVSHARRSYWIVADRDSDFAARYVDQGSIAWLEGANIRANLAALRVIQDKEELKGLDSFPGGAFRLKDTISFEILP